MAAMALPQGAEPRGLGAWGAARAPWLLLLWPQTALTWGRSRGCPGHCPPPAGPAGTDPRAEAWYMSGCSHHYGSPHSKCLAVDPQGSLAPAGSEPPRNNEQPLPPALPAAEMLGPPCSQVVPWEWHWVPVHFLLQPADLLVYSQDIAFFPYDLSCMRKQIGV